MTKHYAALAGVLLAIGGALIWSQMRKVQAPIGPQPLLDIVADSERELSRLPVKFVPLSDADEIKLGRQLEREYVPLWHRAGDDEARDRAIEAYVEEVGALVAAHAHRKLPYRFHYIPGLDFVNSFSLPGGPVFIGGGLMALMETEDELASVLAHEIEHIDHYHCAERAQVQAALQKGPLGGLVGVPVEVFVAGYSKDEELEADREGARLAMAASYSPQGPILMFRAFERFQPTSSARSHSLQEELSQVALQTFEGYFRSHPPTSERIDQIQKMIDGGQLPDWRRTKPMPVAYLFLTERAWRSLEAAQLRPFPFLPDMEKRKRDAERARQFQEALRLALQSLALHSDQPRAQEIQAVAHLGLGEYDAAEAVYREVVSAHPTFADGIRIYADSMARAALRAQIYDQARKLAETSLALQPNQPAALRLLAEAQLNLSDLSGAAATGAKLKNSDPAGAAEVSAEASRLAAACFAEKQYQEAADFASLAVELKPGQRNALATLANAQFALADFAASAEAYRRLLDLNISDMTIIQGYAEALSANHPSTREISEWFGQVHPGNPVLKLQIRTEQAGLMLLAGDDRPARELTIGARAMGSPESLGRLGWWYYRAGKYSEAASLLFEATRQRPGNPILQTDLGFAQVEQQQLEEAIRRFTAAAENITWNAPVMGRAIAEWQLHRSAGALKDYDIAVKNFPEWRNPDWVKAVYSTGAARSVAEMQAARRK